MDVSVSPRPCNVSADDALEGPDDCATASTLPVGLFEDLIVFDDSVNGGADQDYYRITNVLPGEAVSVSLIPHEQQPIALGVRMTDTPDCGGTANPDLDSFAVNQTANPVDFYVYVQTWSGFHQQGSDRTGCEMYDLHVTRIPGACGSLPQDALEPNAPCAQAATITAGTYTGLTLDGSSEDYYEVVMPPQHLLRARVVGAIPEAHVAIESGTACPDSVYYPNTAFYNFGTGMPVVRLRVASVYSMCTAYDLEVRIDPLPCTPGYSADLDPGSTCATAVDLPEGTRPFFDDRLLRSMLALSDFALEPGDEDYLSISVRPHDTYVAYLSSEFDTLDFDAVLAGTCGSPATTSKQFFGVNTNRYLILPNDTDQHLRYVVRVFGPTPQTQCERYQLGYFRGDPCAGLVDTPDAFQQSNVSCATAATVPAASVGYQAVSQGTSRFTRTAVPAGHTLTARLDDDSLFNLGSDVVLALHDGDADCSASGASLGSVVCSAFGSTNSVQFTNNSAQDRDVLIEVRLADQALDCGVVWLDLELDDGAPYTIECLGLDATGLACPCDNQLATPQGGGCANSAGRSARLEGSGSNSVAADDLLLATAEMPPHRQGLLLVELLDPFVQSSSVGQSFYDGKLCLAANGSVGLLRLTSSSQGVWQTTQPLAGLLNAMPGQSHRLQVWYRDRGGPCGAGSNATNSIRVEWQP